MELNKKQHKFWNKMPISNRKNTNGEILDINKNKTNTNKPYKLPSSLSWYNIDIDNEKDSNDIVKFLNENYHDNTSDSYFVFNKNILQWFLGYDDNNKKLAIGLKNKNNFVGCIFGLVRKLNLNNKIILGSETNLLCLNKKIRNLNLAPLLIQELTRRNNYILNLNQSIYTTDLVLPNILGECSYLYRPLNFKRLLRLNMIDKSILNIDDAILQQHFYMSNPKIKGKLVFLNNDNIDLYIDQCVNLLNKKLLQTQISYLFDVKLFRHTFINDLAKCWIIHSKGVVSDMISCYYQKVFLPEEKEYIINCNLYYYFNRKNKIENLVSIVIDDSLLINIDRIKAPALFEYQKLKNFNFDEGFAKLNYYIYNWECKRLSTDNIGYLVF
tara:strand:+ start:5317 stop:6468 length:1152 start_codon:yes stop_codon:yes gene_type:complete